MQLVSTFAKRLKELRIEKDLTLEEFSKLLNMPPQTLSRYELGQRVPKIDTATQIALALNVNPLWLNGFDELKKINSESQIKDMKKTDTLNNSVNQSFNIKNNNKTDTTHLKRDKPEIIAAYGGNSVDAEEKDNEFTEVKKELISTLYAANLDIRQMKELITIIRAFERL